MDSALFGIVKSTRVKDGQTDRQNYDSPYRASIAARALKIGKQVPWCYICGLVLSVANIAGILFNMTHLSLQDLEKGRGLKEVGKAKVKTKKDLALKDQGQGSRVQNLCRDKGHEQHAGSIVG